jgi:hypothetical protein
MAKSFITQTFFAQKRKISSFSSLLKKFQNKRLFSKFLPTLKFLFFLGKKHFFLQVELLFGGLFLKRIGASLSVFGTFFLGQYFLLKKVRCFLECKKNVCQK